MWCLTSALAAGSSAAASGTAEAEARALKDRLVEYDRDSRKRTTVVDDQNDFFEIDTNAWLDPEVCQSLHLENNCIRAYVFSLLYSSQIFWFVHVKQQLLSHVRKGDQGCKPLVLTGKRLFKPELHIMWMGTCFKHSTRGVQS